VYIALFHTHVINRHGQAVTTSITNMDIHDISRTARTYGIKRYYLLTPIEDQHELAERIIGHWRTDHSKEYHPDRVEAVSRVQMARSFDEVKAAISAEQGQEPEVVLTDARPLPNSISYSRYREELRDPGRTKPALIVFGTGWGISEAFYPAVDRILAPIYGPEGPGGYNHLSVRSAVAIILDRLLGK
jgi:hypothetical protein